MYDSYIIHEIEQLPFLNQFESPMAKNTFKVKIKFDRSVIIEEAFQ